MQFPRFSVLVEPSPVRYTVGHVGSLLYLGDQQSRPYGVHRSGRNIIGIPLAHLVAHEQVGERALSHGLQVLFARHRPVESHIKVRSRFAVRHVPHLRFTAASVPLPGQFVAGMHLNGEHVAGVDQLHQHRKLQTVGIVHLFAHQVAHVDLSDLLQVVRFQKTVGDHREIALYTRYFPTFADGPGGRSAFCRQLLARLHEPVAPPDAGLEDRFEFQWIQHGFDRLKSSVHERPLPQN